MATTDTETQAETELAYPAHRMTVDRYERLVESGVYGPDDRVFLWQGRLVEKMGKGRPHVIAQLNLHQLLSGQMPEGYHVELEAPIAIGDASMPEPDLSVVRGSHRDYPRHAPTAAHVAIIAEVSDSSVPRDSRSKLRTYAAEGIPVYWLVNLPEQRIEVYSDPSGPTESPTYRERHDYGPDDEIPVVLDGREVGRLAVRDILP